MIDTSELKLHFDVTDRTIEGSGGPYLEWFQVQVNASTPGFTAEIEWAVMPKEIQIFRDALTQMNKLLPDTIAELKSVEPGIELRLKLGTRGQIDGEFLIANRFHDPEGAVLQGSFGFDQSYLPKIISEVDSLLSYPARSIGA